MTKAEKFQTLAKRLVDKFSLGTCVLHRNLTEDYNTTTGDVARTTEQIPLPAAKDDYILKQYDTAAFSDEHFLLIIAGLDVIGKPPQLNDVVVFPDLSSNVVEKIDVDQYQAAYFLHMKK